MAVHMMDILKQIQRALADQKDYIRNVDRVPNINLTIMGQMCELHKKIDQQQATIEGLEQQIKRNNILLFGNEESDTIVDDKTVVPDTQNIDDKLEKVQVEKSQKSLIFIKTEDYIKNNDKLQAATDEKKFGESTNNETTEETDVTKDESTITVRKASIEKPSPVRKLETVQISPTCFSADQLSKLNSELKRITENYKATNIFPDIEVVPNMSPVDDHPVMKKLCQGVVYSAFSGHGAHPHSVYAIKIGTSGFERDEVRNLLADYPDFSLYDVVREGLKSTNEWRELFRLYKFSEPANMKYPV